MPADTTVARLLRQAEVRGEDAAYFVQREGRWEPTSWERYAAQVRQTARALMAEGFEPGHAACIIGFNRPEWVIFALGATLAGGVPAGVYTTNSAEELSYIVDHAEARFLLIEDLEQWAKVVAERDSMPKLERVVLMEGAEVPDDPLAMGWKDFLALGDGVAEEAVDQRLEGLTLDDVGSLIYTSGTTGPPKAVMLSHGNLAWTASVAVSELFGLGPEDSAVSYLPLSHIAEQMFTIHAALTAGYSIYFAESMEKVAENLRDVQPTMVFGVPRVWERMHAVVSGKLRQATGAKAKLMKWAMGVGRKVSELRCRGEEPTGWLGLQYRLATKLVFSKVKPLMGLGRARVCSSGAAPISRDVLEFFASLDIILYEVYGQSEGCGPTTFNCPGRARLGTVGPPLPGAEVRIADDGEVLLRGPNVFLGYFKDPEATAETLVDGWLCSGDLGAFDDDGFLSIVGRKKEILITSGGKNIAPNNLEALLKDQPIIAEAVIIGDGRKFLSALVVLDQEAAQEVVPDGEAGALHEDSRVLEEVERAIERVNQRVARVESVRKFRVLPQPFTVDAGELTPSLKLKRRVIYEHYSAEIESMYED
ncbi:MAG: long-chain fatty acid--CoA ligase [Acidobacteriota bacterium]|nr:long-chain fatty acid--CoA ligase [Acidobacteriota bacterium]